MARLVSLVILQALLARVALSQEKRDTPTCAGVWFHNDSGNGCCVGGTLPPIIMSTCAGWPICTGPVTTTTTESPISCVTIISESESGYSSKVSAAASSMTASGTHYQSGLTIANAANTAASTGSAPSSAASATATSAGASASASGGASSDSAGVAVNVVVPVMAALGVGFLGAAAYL